MKDGFLCQVRLLDVLLMPDSDAQLCRADRTQWHGWNVTSWLLQHASSDSNMLSLYKWKGPSLTWSCMLQHPADSEISEHHKMQHSVLSLKDGELSFSLMVSQNKTVRLRKLRLRTQETGLSFISYHTSRTTPTWVLPGKEHSQNHNLSPLRGGTFSLWRGRHGDSISSPTFTWMFSVYTGMLPTCVPTHFTP